MLPPIVPSDVHAVAESGIVAFNFMVKLPQPIDSRRVKFALARLPDSDRATPPGGAGTIGTGERRSTTPQPSSTIRFCAGVVTIGPLTGSTSTLISRRTPNLGK